MSILPLCLFPNVYWWSIFLQQQDVFIDISENYQKQTYRNRFRILSANGPLDISVPVQSTQGEKKSISEIIVSEEFNIRGTLETIRSAYGRSAFFEFYFSDVEHMLLNARSSRLLDLNTQTFQWCLKQLKISEVQPFSTEKFLFNIDPKDYRSAFKTATCNMEFKTYPQVFSDRFGFVNNLSIIDLLFNMGPKALDYIVLEKNGGNL